MRRRIVVWAIVLIGVVRAAVAVAEPDPEPTSDEQAARSAFARGRAAYDNGHFSEAARAFDEAYRLSGKDPLLYNLYLAHRDANHQEEAAEALRAFLAKVPDIENRAQLEARLKALDEGIAWERAQRERARALEQKATEPPPAPAPTDERPRRLVRAGYALSATAGALLVAALATGLSARKKERALEDGCDASRTCPRSLEETASRGERLARTTDGLLFSGLAVAGTGATLLVLGLRQTGERAPELGASCDRTGCVARLGGRF